MIHELKIEQAYFQAVIDGDKNFEIRFNDRGFQKGDSLVLSEIAKVGMTTYRKAKADISYVTNFNQAENWVVFGIKNVSLITANKEE